MNGKDKKTCRQPGRTSFERTRDGLMSGTDQEPGFGPSSSRTRFARIVSDLVLASLQLARLPGWSPRLFFDIGCRLDPPVEGFRLALRANTGRLFARPVGKVSFRALGSGRNVPIR